MPVVDALRSHADATGDSRIVPFLTRYFEFQNSQPGAVFAREPLQYGGCWPCRCIRRSADRPASGCQ
jgi:hypothetical protein